MVVWNLKKRIQDKLLKLRNRKFHGKVDFSQSTGYGFILFNEIDREKFLMATKNLFIPLNKPYDR